MAVDDIAFKKLILNHWRRHGRHELPWRKTDDPYHILVSEIMLQQTQVPRVIEKYQEFLRVFPTFRVLADASTQNLLRVWQGLGYNRRALLLQRCARVVTREYQGKLPKDWKTLTELPGIGPYTAGAILAFAFNAPHPVIETNIRRIMLHHYFPGRTHVSDERILPIVERTLDRRNPRRWYSALMDYGTTLATVVQNPNRRSKHYARQSKFEGSDRQIRGAVIRMLTKAPATMLRLAREVSVPAERLENVIAGLTRDGFIKKKGRTLLLG